MPEIEGPQRDATIWLNDPLPDPTPVAKRLSLDFARELTDASREAGVDWPVVLAVLRAQGADGTEPADARTVRRLAARLAGLADGNHSTWAVALAYGGSATFADRATVQRSHTTLPSSVRSSTSIQKPMWMWL